MLKAELWDKMQHIMSKYNDHMMHTVVRYDSHIDLETYKRALAIAIDKVPIVKHRFCIRPIEPCWKPIKNFDINDVIKVIETDADPFETAEKYMAGVINERKEAQIKQFIIRTGTGDTVASLMNHMCFDGPDLRIFNGLVVEIYNDLKMGGKGDIPVKNGTRAESQLLENLSPEDRKIAEGLIAYNKDAKNPVRFPFSEYDRKKIRPRFIKSFTQEPEFLAAKNYGRMQGVTLNDIIVGCFYRALAQIVDIPESGIGIPNMIDLRKYLKSGETEGFTNLIGMTVCNIGGDIGKDVFETVAKVHEDMQEKKSHFPGLHGLPNLRRAFKIVPYFLSYPLIGLFYKNPLIGISNIGIIDEKQYTLFGTKIVDTYMTGSVKYPPYIQLALTTFRNRITYTFAVYCNDRDAELFAKLLDLFQIEFRHYGLGRKLS